MLDARWYVTHSGLLRVAHRRRCSSITTELVEGVSNPKEGRWVFKASWDRNWPRRCPRSTRGIQAAFPGSGIVSFLQGGHHVEGVAGRQVVMDDAVAQAGTGLLLLNEGVSIDDPIHGTIAGSMGADGDAVLVEEANH